MNLTNTESDPLSAPHRSRLYRVAAPVLVALGVALALFQFLSGRDIWMDEALLSLNILRRSPAGLFQPLELLQSAPIGFLLCEKTLSGSLPDPDFALRLFPLLCFVAGLVAFERIMRRSVPRDGFALAAVALYAVSNGLLYFSCEVKQYGVDAMFATFLLGVATTPLPPERIRARRLAALGSAAVFFSNAACLVLPGVWLHWVLSREDSRKEWRWLWVGAAWAAAFAVYFALFFNDPNRAQMQHNWEYLFPAFPFRGTGFVGGLRMIPGKMRHLLLFAFGFHPVALGVAVAAFGGLVAAIRRRAWPLLALVALPPALHVVVAMLRLYPLDIRLMIYQTPIVLLAMAIPGMEPCRGRRDSRGFGLLALPVLAVLLLVPNLPLRRCEQRACIQYIAEHIGPGDRVAVGARLRSAFSYYATTRRIPDAILRLGADPRGDGLVFLSECGLAPEYCRRTGDELHGRTWVIDGWDLPGSETPKGAWESAVRWATRRYTGFGDLRPFFAQFERHLVEHHGGKLLDEFVSYGAKASLYEFPSRSVPLGNGGGEAPARRDVDKAVEGEAAVDAQQ